MPLFHRWILLGAALVVAGCTTTPNERQVDMAAQAIPQRAWTAQHAAKATEPAPYRLQVGDVVDLRFRGTKELDAAMTLRPDGRISMPWVGEVAAAGLTPRELAKELDIRYAGVLRRPQAEVVVRSFQPARVYVGGEVARPGELRLSGSVSLLQAIVQAGDFTPDAKRNSVIVVRPNGAGEPDYIKVDFGSAVVRRVAEAADEPCAQANPGACPGEMVQRPEAFMLESLDLVIVPKTQIAGVAQFFERYVNQILPVWRNFGLSATYPLRRDTLVIPDSR